MSISTPPSVYFNGINFNPAFYSIGDEAVTFKFIDANYLRSTNYAISRAAYTQFYGIIYALSLCAAPATHQCIQQSAAAVRS